MIIYGIKNKETDRLVYIGQTVRSLSERWSQHLRDSDKLDYPLYRAFRKHSKENFQVIELSKAVDLEDLNKKEIDLIKSNGTLAPNGYNILLGGQNSPLPEEVKAKIKVAALKNGFGKWERTEKDNQKNRERALAQHSDPVKHLSFCIGNGSKEFEVYKAIVMKRHCNGKKAIIQKGELVGSFFTQTECAKKLNIESKHIASCLNGKRRTVSGYMFEPKQQSLKEEIKENE